MKEKDKGWHGDYIDIVFHNGSRLHCDLKEYQHFNASTDDKDHIDIKDTCTNI